MADSIGDMKVPSNIDVGGADAEQVRCRLGETLNRHALDELTFQDFSLACVIEALVKRKNLSID
jgi:hypothetical protein